ncbi:MAG: ribosome biogenesis GTPase Der, partial [Planctomycetota bacterium]
VLLLIDSTTDVGAVDKRLARYIVDQFKPCIIVVNKWDLAKDRTTTELYGEYLTKILLGLVYAPIAFLTATTGKNVQSVIDLSAVLFKQAQTRVPTGRLNSVVAEATEQKTPTLKRGTGKLKIYYASQVATCPPTIVFFVNHLARVSPTYERFLLNRIRDMVPFAEVPIRLLFRSHRAMEKTNKLS